MQQIVKPKITFFKSKKSLHPSKILEFLHHSKDLSLKQAITFYVLNHNFFYSQVVFGNIFFFIRNFFTRIFFTRIFFIRIFLYLNLFKNFLIIIFFIRIFFIRIVFIRISFLRIRKNLYIVNNILRNLLSFNNTFTFL